MKITATPTVVSEDHYVWQVACQGGCGNIITVAKRTWDYQSGAVTELTAPTARRCSLCGPFAKV